MKNFLLGAVVGAAAVITTLSGVAYAVGPVYFNAKLVSHDALGHTRQVTAAGNSLTFSAGTPATPSTSTLTLEYTSDQVLCSGFGN